MDKSNEYATTKSSSVRCLEVMISKEGLAKNAGLLWTLSVYSLENEPVAKNRAADDSELFHFMVFDWNRTIRKLLDNHKVAFSITMYFSPASIFSASHGVSGGGVCDPDYAAAAGLHDAAALTTTSILSRLPDFPQNDLILEQEVTH